MRDGEWELGFVYRRDDGLWAKGVEHDRIPEGFVGDLQEADFTRSPMYRGWCFFWREPVDMPEIFTEDFEIPPEPPVHSIETLYAWKNIRTEELVLESGHA